MDAEQHRCSDCGAQLDSLSAHVCPRCLLRLAIESPAIHQIPEGRVAQFNIIGELGRGGMGQVFLAEDTVLRRQVALKFVADVRRGSPEASRHLVREARAAAGLDHPYICHIHEVGEENETVFIAMEYVEGETLSERIAAGPLTLAEFADLAPQILEAVEAAHTKGIIHGDLKPSNIMVTARGHVKVMDFGLARTVERDAPDLKTTLERRGIAGTVAYMAPEQIGGEPTDRRSDIFSLGIIFWEMLAGRHPFLRRSALEVARAIGQDDPDIPAGVPAPPGPLLRVLDRMLAKDPEQRYSSADRARLGLQRALSLALPRPPWWKRRLEALEERRRLALPYLAAVAAAGAALLTQHFVTLALSVIAFTWMVLRARSWRRLAPATIAVLAIAIGGLLTAETGLHTLWAAEEERRQVFVVLSFEKDRWETERQLLEHITRSFRSTVETTFATLPNADVVVVPREFDRHAFDDWSYEVSRERILDQIADGPIAGSLCLCFRTVDVPDLILRNYVSVQGEVVGDRNLILVTALNRLNGRDLVPTGGRLRIEGNENDLRHLVLRATYDFLVVLRQDPQLPFTQDDETRIKHQLLDLYRDFLSQTGEADIEHQVSLAQELLIVSDEQIKTLLAAHRSAFDTDSYRRALEAARNSNLEKLTIGQ